MTESMATRRTAPAVLMAVLALLGALTAAPSAHVAPAAPFLWEGQAGTHRLALFGTIHVPDARVLDLPPAVRAAFARADRVVTEIPMDGSAQAAMASALMLPEPQRLRTVIGEARFTRLEARVQAALAPRAPMAVPLLVGMLDRLKPWAAMAQLASLEYLPDLLDGKVPLDARIYADAASAGKRVGGLETVAEQAAVFDVFTADEQTQMLESALRDLESPGNGPTSASLVQSYLEGDDATLTAALSHAPGDAALARKFQAEVLVARNHRMAERIDALRRDAPAEALFVAVGALHLVGPDNLPQLLTARGYALTRVKP
ncbi:MAG TPA: TraB/GumN family protein [Luteitalea sp.]|nr:TraB/GumN family protein [Luteitalea sp.]